MEIILIALLGWISGALVNYLSDILPIRRRLVRPFCLHCGAPQTLSHYAFWPRRCPDCGTYRGKRTWVVELLFIGASMWLWLRPPSTLNFTLGFLLLIYFGVVFVIDLEHRLIIHPVSLVGLFLGLGIGVYLHGLKATILGGLTGFAIMLLLYLSGGVLMGWIAKRRGQALEEEALGFGDVNLGGVIGLLLGWPGIIAGVIFTILLAGAVSLIYLVYQVVSRRYHAYMAIPYGPFLISSTIILLYFRDYLIQ